MGTRFKAARNSVVKRLKRALGLSDILLSAKKESTSLPTPPARTDIPIQPAMPRSPKPTSRTKSSQSTPAPPPIPEGVEPAPLSLSDADYEQNYNPKPPPVPKGVQPASLSVSDEYYEQHFKDKDTPPPVPERTYPKKEQSSPSNNQYQELPLGSPPAGQYQDLPLGPNVDLLKQQIGALNTEQLGEISSNVPENATGDLIMQVIWATRDLKALNQQELSTFIEHFPKVLEKCGITLLTPEALAQQQKTALETEREHCIESLQKLVAEWQFQEINSPTEQADVVEKTKQQLMSRSATLFRNDEAVKPLIDELNRNMQNHLQIEPTPSVDQSNLPPFGGLARQDTQENKEEPQARQSTSATSNQQQNQNAQADQSPLQYTKLPPERKRQSEQPSPDVDSNGVVIGGYTDEQKAALQKQGIIPKYAQSQPEKQQSPFFNEYMAQAYLEELEIHAPNPPDWIFEGIEKFLKGTKGIEGNQVLDQLRQQLEQRTQAQKQALEQPAKPEVIDNRSHIRAKIGAHRVEDQKSTIKKKNT